MKSYSLTLVALTMFVSSPLWADPTTPAASTPATNSADVLQALVKMAAGDAEAVKFDPAAKADFAIPQASAAAVLDSSAQLLRPATPRETVTSVLSNFEDGKLKTGFSIAVTPYTLLRATPLQWGEYAGTIKANHDPYYYQFMARLQLSLAATTGGTTSGTTGTSPAVFGGGVNAIIFDDGDPRISKAFKLANDALAKVAHKLLDDAEAQNQVVVNGGTPTPVTPDPALKQTATEALKKAQKDSWNAAAMGVGYAVRFKSATGKINDAKESGGGAWLNLSTPGFGSLAANSQFLFSASYRYHDDFKRDGVSGVQDTFNTGAQLRVGAADHNYYGQWFYKWRHPKGSSQSNDSSVEFGTEFKVMENLWLNLAWSNDKDLGGNSAVKTGLRYGFGKKAVLYPGP